MICMALLFARIVERPEQSIYIRRLQVASEEGSKAELRKLLAKSGIEDPTRTIE